MRFEFGNNRLARVSSSLSFTQRRRDRQNERLPHGTRRQGERHPHPGRVGVEVNASSPLQESEGNRLVQHLEGHQGSTESPGTRRQRSSEDLCLLLSTRAGKPRIFICTAFERFGELLD